MTLDQDNNDFGFAQLNTQRATNFDPDREPYFFYNVWSHERDGSGSSGVCCSSRKGFIVSLGAWTGQNGTVRDQSGTFVHELGHNINLGHGGGDGVNFKPNYLSVMNYRYQVTGIPNWDTWAAAGFAGNQMIASSTIDYSSRGSPRHGRDQPQRGGRHQRRQHGGVLDGSDADAAWRRHRDSDSTGTGATTVSRRSRTESPRT